jgi:hypothetical protein
MKTLAVLSGSIKFPGLKGAINSGHAGGKKEQVQVNFGLNSAN